MKVTHHSYLYPPPNPPPKKPASKPASKFGGGFYLEADWRQVLFLEAGFD
jgi:hypothetical protein